jgi:antibiotic biosynthesis monooxygenase (ABM) superfamily enzyme
MNTHNPISSSELQEGSTGIITHRVREGRHADYETWLNEIGAVCQTYPGHLDKQFIRPISGLTNTYTVILRFDTHEHLHNWIHSKDRKAFLERVRPLLCKEDEVTIKSGLDFWFTPQGAKAKLPTRWKQCLLTWSALYPTGTAVQWLLSPMLQQIRLFDNHYVKTLFISGVVVLMMVYVVMPRYTKLVQHWLFD